MAGISFTDQELLDNIESLPDCEIADLNIDLLNTQFNFPTNINFGNMEMQ